MCTTSTSTMRRRHTSSRKDSTRRQSGVTEPPLFSVAELLQNASNGTENDLPLPPAISCSDAQPAASEQDTASVDSSGKLLRRRFDKVYDCPPVVNRGTIMAAGLFIFALAMIWPPLILLFTYIASKLIPYTLRENDDAAKRRELYSQFVQDEDNLPEAFVRRFERVNIDESYWTNERCVHVYSSIWSSQRTAALSLNSYSCLSSIFFYYN